MYSFNRIPRVLALGCSLMLSLYASAQSNDPFSSANEFKAGVGQVATKPGVVGAKDDFNSLLSGGGKRPKGGPIKPTPIDDRIGLRVEITPLEAMPGQIVRYTIYGTPKRGFHTYPITQRADSIAQEEGALTKLKVETGPDLEVLWPMTESKPEWAELPGVGKYLEFNSNFEWSQDILILPTAKPGPNVVRFLLNMQACDNTCVVGSPELEATVVVKEGVVAPISAEIAERRKMKQMTILVLSGPGSEILPIGEGDKATASKDEPQSMFGWLFVSSAAAIAMLFTPCVFPMIPITVSFFLKQSEKKHHNALLTAAVYSTTIILVLTATVLVLGEIIVSLANNPWLNLGLGIMLVAFALSLFGMYELELPASLSNYTASQQGRGGYLGVIFMSLTFTITSFTCTGPFLGPLLGTLKEVQLSFMQRALGALVYSATFAAPFFVLALFPRLLKSLPKSGGWLNAVKVVMGFLELGAAFKFLANTDLALNPGRPMFFNYETVLCGWIALSIACGLYLFGLYRLPHDSPVEYLGVPRMLLGGLFFGLSVYMMPLMLGNTPQGVVGAGLVAFLPPNLQPHKAGVGGSGEGTELTWYQDYSKAYELAAKEQKLLFIDFTGQYCTNCRYNEANIFTKPNVLSSLKQYVRVQLYTDFVPDPKLSYTQSGQMGDANKALLKGTFQDITNPFYAIIRPEKGKPPWIESANGVLSLTGATPALTRKGLISQALLLDFETFLSKPLQGALNKDSRIADSR